MPRKKQAEVGQQNTRFDLGTVSDKQAEFLKADTFYVCYGGAKGGGKSHVVRIKAVGMCIRYPGIRILMMRCHYPELEENIIRPLLKMLPGAMYEYNGAKRLLTFENGSTIKFGHYDGDRAENEYQGVEYDVIFIDEATQFSWRAFQYLGGCIRGVNDFPKRMYLTCNPGGVGHRWVKRLFIDKQYIVDPDNPEATENPADYTFIFATVEDNKYLLESSPKYLQNLAQMPEDQRRAFRYGDWDALGGNYFKEFTQGVHTTKRFRIPSHWSLYRSFDYGLDMLACVWWAVDEDGRSWAFREYERGGLIVSEAAQDMLHHTLPGEKIQVTYAPPDMWNRQKDTGQTMAELFTLSGLSIVKSDNNRVQGHMVMKNMMAPMPLNDPFVKALFPAGEAPATLPGLMVFDDLKRIISDIRDIQADEDNPNDCAKQPHDITHSVDACRYFCVNRSLAAEKPKAAEDEEEEDGSESYESYMCGGEVTDGYMSA